MYLATHHGADACNASGAPIPPGTGNAEPPVRLLVGQWVPGHAVGLRGHRLLRSSPRRAVGITTSSPTAEAEFRGALNAGGFTPRSRPHRRRLRRPRPAAARVRPGTTATRYRRPRRWRVTSGACFFPVHTSSRALPRRVLREPERAFGARPGRASKPRALTTRPIT